MAPSLKSDARRASWTFGTVMCVRPPATQLSIVDVAYEMADTDGVEVQTFVRKIPSDDIPVIAWKGRPQSTLEGEIDVAEGASIGSRCGAKRGLIELLTVVTAGREGARITKTELEYRLGNQERTVGHVWEMGICGTEVQSVGCE